MINVFILYYSRQVFGCPVMFSLWRIRRSWLRNVVKKCSNIEIQREIFKRLGEIVYSIWSGADLSDALKDFIQDFSDQTAFTEYFKAFWVPKIGKTCFLKPQSFLLPVPQSSQMDIFFYLCPQECGSNQ